MQLKRHEQFAKVGRIICMTKHYKNIKNIPKKTLATYTNSSGLTWGCSEKENRDFGDEFHHLYFKIEVNKKAGEI